jgi:hypothetical protein
VAGLTPLLLLSLASGASADAPSKAGWWNGATANGIALPMPTTSAGDLHVAQGPSSPLAYAAVGYDLAGQGVDSATLQLKVTANSTVATIDVMACPTKDASWKAGDDQPIDSAPAYDCSAGSKGIVSADGATVTFLLDSGQLLGGTAYSLAIVPRAGSTPFSVDFTKPGPTSLATEAAPTTEAAAPPAAPVAAAPPAPKTGTTVTPPLSAAVVPVAPQVALPAPAVAVPLTPAPAPAVAPAAPQVAAAAARPATPVSNRARYAAGTGLALLAGFLVWAFQQSSPEPRLLGGLARKAGPAAVAVDSTPRGIGRFATMRTSAPRPLL